VKNTRDQMIRSLDAVEYRPRESGQYVPGRRPSPFLQIFRHQTHLAFDRLWKNGYMTRNQAYLVLRELTGLPPELVHIRLFDAVQCFEACEFFDGLTHGRADWMAERRRFQHQSRGRGRAFRKLRRDLAASDVDDEGGLIAC
jgi:hypothetical protein